MPAYNIEIERNIWNDAYYPYIDLQTRLQILFGGSSSGKSVFIADRLVRDLLKGGRNYLGVRKTQRSIRQSQFSEVIRSINRFNCVGLFDVNWSVLTITCVNGQQALFTGLDDVEKIKSIVPQKGVITDIWIEEATQTTPDDFKQLKKRLRGRVGKGIIKRIMMSFNPILRSHWIYVTFFSGRFNDQDTLYHDDKLFILKTTYLDNRFLEQDDIENLEDETDEYYHSVYTLGNWGVLGDLVFRNWRVEDILRGVMYPTFDLFRNGLDFGFTNDPTAFNRSYYHRATRTIYVTHEYHERGVTNDVIAKDIKKIAGDDQVVCDSAEPKSIQELCNHGINAIGARKGKDSTIHGLQWLAQQAIVIDTSCTYTIAEFEQYHWKKNKDGKVLNEPADRDNHHIDELRYQYEDEMLTDTEESVEGVGESVAVEIDW